MVTSFDAYLIKGIRNVSKINRQVDWAEREGENEINRWFRKPGEAI